MHHADKGIGKKFEGKRERKTKISNKIPRQHLVSVAIRTRDVQKKVPALYKRKL